MPWADVRVRVRVRARVQTTDRTTGQNHWTGLLAIGSGLEFEPESSRQA